MAYNNGLDRYHWLNNFASTSVPYFYVNAISNNGDKVELFNGEKHLTYLYFNTKTSIILLLQGL